MTTRHFFVDEAGDLTLFDRHGRPMLGREGVSHYFMVGVAEIVLPDDVARLLSELRSQMIADPYFNRAPSFHPERRRTAVVFHAKDDLPEVRWWVYQQLRVCHVRFAAVIRRKSVLESLAMNSMNCGRRVSVDAVYDGLVTQLFADRLASTDDHHITFAVRKTSYRDAALVQAIERASTLQPRPIRFVALSDQPAAVSGLQVVDYYLWATQRFFERNEGRFIAGMADQVEYIWDLDDDRGGPAGVRYEGKRGILELESKPPLTPARFEETLEHPT